MSDLDLLTVGETARMLRASEDTVRRWLAEGLLKAIKIGREWRIPRESIMAHMKGGLEEQERGSDA